MLWIILCIAYTGLNTINEHIILRHDPILLLILGIILTIALIFPTLIWMLKTQRNYAKVKFSLKHRIILVIVGIVLMSIFGNIEIGSTSQVTNDHIIDDVIHSGNTGLTFMILAVLIGPIMEEFLCRFMIIGPNPIGERYIHKWIYFIRILIGSVIFALLHLTPNLITGNLSDIGQMLLGVAPQLEAGLILAYLYVHTQDIRVSIFTHVIYDLIGVIIIFIV